MARLAELPRIVGVKDATQDLARPLRTLKSLEPYIQPLVVKARLKGANGR